MPVNRKHLFVGRHTMADRQPLQTGSLQSTQPNDQRMQQPARQPRLHSSRQPGSSQRTQHTPPLISQRTQHAQHTQRAGSPHLDQGYKGLESLHLCPDHITVLRVLLQPTLAQHLGHLVQHLGSAKQKEHSEDADGGLSLCQGYAGRRCGDDR